jgi:hypothetical protein
VWPEWLSFVALGVVANTALGPPFEPVLLWFAGGRAGTAAWAFIIVGSLCAGAGGALEAAAGRRMPRLRKRSPPSPRSPALFGPRGWLQGRSFYAFAAVASALPVPFTMVRLAALARRPRPLVYGACVAAGRLPRYAVTVLAWDGLSNLGRAAARW